MAQGTFAPLYIHVEMDLMARHERVLLDVLRGLVWHADPYGMCWPGPRRLADVTRRSEETIPGYIQQLVEMDFVRIHRRADPVRRKWQITYQISPFVMYIREEIEPQAKEIWETGSNVINETDFVTKPVQPESEPEQNQRKPESGNQNQNHHHNQKKNKNSPSNAKASGGARNNGKRGKPKEQNQPQSGESRPKVIPEDQPGGEWAAANGRENQKIDFTPFRTPLADAGDELLAGRIARRLSTREAQARQLVAAYGRSTVETALRWIDEELAKGYHVEKPFGLMKWWLKENVISAEDKPEPDEPKSATGEYADFFDR